MASNISVLGPLLEHLTPLLKKAGIKREQDEAGIAIYSRQGDGVCHRIGLAIEKGPNRKSEFELGAIVGIEFAEFPRLKLWQGLPRTHKAVSLGTLVPEAKHRLVCSKGTDWKALALQLAQWVAVALEVLDAQRGKLRFAHVSQFEQAGSNRKRALAIIAERKQKGLRARLPRGKGQAAEVITDKLNVFEIAGKLLRARSDKIEQLDSYEFTDESEAHDATVWRQRQAEFVRMARLIEAELQSAPLKPAETGESENDLIPVNGVLYYALWRVGWKYLYVVASQEDTELPIVLLMGTTNIAH
jgi:hypothetical protein